MLEALRFSQVENELEDQDRTAIQLWQTNTQKKSWNLLPNPSVSVFMMGARYRDIRVLLAMWKLINCNSRPFLISIRSPLLGTK